MSKNRSATRKTLLVLEHHAKPLKELWAVVTQYVAESDWSLDSARGGPNSWSILSPGGHWLTIRGRMHPWRLEVSDGTTITTRNQAISWCEKVL